MSFEKACDYLTEYQKTKQAAMNNEKRSKWFLYPLKKLTDIKDDIFERGTERTDWSKDYQSPTSTLPRLALLEMKVTVLAGWYKDIRMIFTCGPDNRVRTPVDFDRATYMHSVAAELSVSHLKNMLVKVKPKG